MCEKTQMVSVGGVFLLLTAAFVIYVQSFCAAELHFLILS